ncbi:hypothetical protein HDK77DRAFT_479453 [Phyllosticta capitalensis]|uniref:Uncharacterized protein n=1 Tax=Phyllosticta capitalensis TaxID=121624 RepID=A0ABR1YUE5_9PEZI
MPATVRPDEIAFNKASVALARSQALISSWLPAQSAAETKSQAQIDEDDPFKPEPELLGVGAEAPKEILDGSFRRQHLSSDELRKKLLPKGALRAQATDKKTPLAKPAPKKPERPAPKQDESDEEEGRAAMFKSRRQHKAPAKTTDSDESEDEVKGKASQSKAIPERKKKRMTFMDEMLEERAKKKKK